MSYVANMFLLVRSSVWSKQLLYFVQGQGQKSEQKPPTTENFVGFHIHSPLLTMIKLKLLILGDDDNSEWREQR